MCDHHSCNFLYPVQGAKIKKECAKTGDGPSTDETITPLENMALTIMDKACYEG